MRAKGEGSVFEVNGKVFFQESFSVDGRRKYITGSGSTLKQARDRQRKNVERFHQGLKRERVPKHSLSSVLDEWLGASSQIQEASRTRYRNNIRRHVIEPLDDPAVEALTKTDLRALFSTMLPEREVGPSAIHHAQQTLRTLLNFAVEREYIAVNPLSGVKVSKSTQVEFGDAKFIQRNTGIFLSMLDWMEQTQHERYPMVLMLSLGLRISEVLGLEWDCFTSLTSNAKATVEVRQQLTRSGDGPLRIKTQTKTRTSVRRIPLPSRHRLAIVALKKQNRQAKDDWARNLVFLQPSGAVFRPEHFNDVWRGIFDDFYTAKKTPENQRYYFRPHYCRHIAASLYISSGESVKVVQELLGHSSSSMTLDVYAHSTSDEKRKATEFLAAASHRSKTQPKPV